MKSPGIKPDTTQWQGST